LIGSLAKHRTRSLELSHHFRCLRVELLRLSFLKVMVLVHQGKEVFDFDSETDSQYLKIVFVMELKDILPVSPTGQSGKRGPSYHK
jgi:hypothetical protein